MGFAAPFASWAALTAGAAQAGSILGPTLAVASLASPWISQALTKTPSSKAPKVPVPERTAINKEAAEAQEREMLRRRASGGQSTILTGPLGRVSEDTVGRTILGGT